MRNSLEACQRNREQNDEPGAIIGSRLLLVVKLWIILRCSPSAIRETARRGGTCGAQPARATDSHLTNSREESCPRYLQAFPETAGHWQVARCLPGSWAAADRSSAQSVGFLRQGEFCLRRLPASQASADPAGSRHVADRPSAGPGRSRPAVDLPAACLQR